MTFCSLLVNGPYLPPISPRSPRSGPPPGPSPTCGASIAAVRLLIMAFGAWLMWLNLDDVRFKQRLSKLITGARALDPAAKAGDVVWVEGRVVGGHDAGEKDGLPLYDEHLLIEDNRGRRIRVGVPGRDEVRWTYPAERRVLLVGELAEATDPYRSVEELTLTNGRTKSLRVELGDRHTVLLGLEVSYLRDLRDGLILVVGGLFFILAGIVLATAGSG